MKTFHSLFALFLLVFCCAANAQSSSIQRNVAVAWYASCAIEASGRIECWGGNDNNEQDSPDGEFLQIAGTHLRFCAIRSDKALVCWGSQRNGADTIPVEGQWDEVYVGQYQSCARRESGEVTCWGNGDPTPPDRNFTQIGMGKDFVCGLDTSGSAHCWGERQWLIDETPSGTYTQLFSNDNSVCVKAEDEPWYCWGEYVDSEQFNEHSWLDVSSQDEVGILNWCGIKTDNTVYCPFGGFKGATDVIDIEVGAYQTCAIKRNGRLHCGGFFPREFIAKTPMTESSTVQLTVSQGGQVVASNDERCNNDCVIYSEPVDELTLTAEPEPGYRFEQWFGDCTGRSAVCKVTTDTFRKVTAQFTKASAEEADNQYLSMNTHGGCAITREQALVCWGDEQQSLEPPEGNYVSVALSDRFGCAIRQGVEAACWGEAELPVVNNVPELSGVVEIEVGESHACARTADGQGVCWGDNTYQQAMLNETNVTSIAAGERSSCALLEGGRLICAGFNTLEDEARGIIKLIDAADLHVSDYGLCARMFDGSIDCASRDTYIPSTLPVFYDSTLDAVSICGINAYGVGRCSRSYTDYILDSTLQDIAISGSRVCALSDEGRVECWQGDEVLGSPLPSGVRVGPVPEEVVVNVQFNGDGVLYDSNGDVLCDSDCVLPRSSTETMVIKVDAGRFAYWTGDCVGFESRCSVNAQRNTTVTAHFLDELPHESVNGTEAYELTGLSGCYFDERGNLQCFTEAEGLPRLNYPSTQNLINIALGGASCGIRYDKALHCWSTVFDERVRNVPNGEFVELDAGRGFACAIDTDNELVCWGRSVYSFNYPVGENVSSISIYDGNACVLKDDKRAVCWGDYAEFYAAPDTVFEKVEVSRLRHQNFGACGTTASGTVECWGRVSDNGVPTEDVQEISMANWGGCAVLDSGELTCWGSDSHGQQQIPEGRFVSVVVTTYGACAMRIDGEIVCWGEAFNYVNGNFSSVYVDYFTGAAPTSPSSGLLMLIMAWQALQEAKE